MKKHTYILPEPLHEDYDETFNQDALLKSRATALRRCIEGFIAIFFPMIAKRGKLSGQINGLKKSGYLSLCEKLDYINEVTKNGAHFNTEVSRGKFNIALDKLPELVVDIFAGYYKSNPICVEEKTLVLLSTLPPALRIQILNNYLNNDSQNEFAIEKLAMAYCKNGMLTEGLDFLKNAYDAGNIRIDIYEWLTGKITRIHNELDRLPIATNLKESIAGFNYLTGSGQYAEYEEFIEIMEKLLTIEKM